ncbi:hypothetical protein AVEN_159576-1 [Araneus ventricosus]|uniref:Uncharacterized protein n=1 Tax=Araneus ventricosus TaxID=182803 RepID=A0A4Y2T560_ARAVE|nr:hypothetical protein AVEN_159576-1 [Araneus ventricosus]
MTEASVCLALKEEVSNRHAGYKLSGQIECNRRWKYIYNAWSEMLSWMVVTTKHKKTGRNPLAWSSMWFQHDNCLPLRSIDVAPPECNAWPTDRARWSSALPS